MVSRWGAEPAVLAWTDLALDLIRTHKPSPVRAGRALALLHAALHDTVIATTDAQHAYRRPSPATIESAIMPLGEASSTGFSFPSEHAAVAAAAETVLVYLFPDEPAEDLATLSEEAATSRLWAGTNVRSDVETGQAIGRAVGERAVVRGKADGSDSVWDGSTRRTGDGFWQPTPPKFVPDPLDPLAGTWQTWVISSGDALRPPPPPEYLSPEWQADLASVQEAVARRTPEQEAAALFWAGGPENRTPAGIWIEIARDLILQNGLDLLQTARALALTTVAMADGFICCWDAKYAYWTERPITADPSLDVLIPTPPFPSYTSGHSTISAAAATVLAHLFPSEAHALADLATEAKYSRLWAGIHFPSDNEMGALGGGMIGRLVANVARNDGSE